MRSIYGHVKDIDLFVGMLHETKDDRDSIVGKTFRLKFLLRYSYLVQFYVARNLVILYIYFQLLTFENFVAQLI